MTTVTQATFARLMGVNRSTVSRTWKQAGRLVMIGGQVDVEASKIRIQETGGIRIDVAARHEAQRAQAIPTHQPEPESAARAGNQAADHTAAPPRGIETRAEAGARKESIAADLLEMEMAQKMGNLVPRDDVDTALRSLGALVRSALDVFPDQTAPLIAPVTNLDDVHALLSESCRNVLAGIADHLHRQEQALAAGQPRP